MAHIIPSPFPKSNIANPQGLLSSAAEAAVNKLLQGSDVCLYNKIGMAVISSLPYGVTIKALSARVLHDWDLGAVNKDGVLYLVCAHGRQHRITTRKHASTHMSDAVCQQILQDINPALQTGNIDAAVQEAAHRIVRALAHGRWQERKNYWACAFAFFLFFMYSVWRSWRKRAREVNGQPEREWSSWSLPSLPSFDILGGASGSW
eukprot:TRINITY_DN43120_c0_g1_i1.p1 TRINITY_DN43120_c0_g1~~TRINITY_DN43120_c0_g1_i1.p1  ORF type:complete len:205 (-),score=36.14 TRINITY_DN43120_c0_g1_i1:40-654(-)